ncbi:TetR/AcrR family transcriptional regulator [Saccharopolyspora mangrovi]|uniref:TetR/AcrR family transcriptional regulator n=1 Tax=Saccharopolyspora mangrovi TaxID=3082379 RepID=UPI003899C6E3
MAPATRRHGTDGQAGETRERQLRSAIAECALKGYFGTSTETIAERVGVTQPYFFRLFPGKKAIAVALTRSTEDARRTRESAAKG